VRCMFAFVLFGSIIQRCVDALENICEENRLERSSVARCGVVLGIPRQALSHLLPHGPTQSVFTE